MSVTVIQTNLVHYPALDPMNQFLKIYYGEDQEFESETQYESGPNAQFNTNSYDLGTGAEEDIVIEVWSKESFHEGIVQDVHLGSCVVALDQLKIGHGICEFFDLLIDNAKMGKVQIKSVITKETIEEPHPDELPAEMPSKPEEEVIR